MEVIEIIGYVAGGMTTISFIPQVLKTLHSKETRDISLGMYLLFTIGVLLWLFYGIVIHNMPISIANTITLCLALIVLAAKLLYG